MKKAISILRVSSKEQQEGYSIDAQKKLIHEYARKNSIKIIYELEEAESAKSSGRTQFNKLLKLLKENPDIKDILVEKTDRLYRSMKDYVTLKDYDINLHLVKEGEIFNKQSKSHQKLIHNIKVVLAENYIDNLSEEVKKGHQEKVEQGGYPHAAPIGFKNNKENHTLEIEENGARLVRALYELYSTGNYSLWTLRKKVIEDGLTTMYTNSKIPTSTIARILQSPIYLGKIPFKDKIYPGNHKSLISEELFSLVGGILRQNAKRKSKNERKHAFMGLMNCSCGCLITAEIQKRKYVYYHCTNAKRTCKKIYVREEILGEKFAELLKGLEMDKKQLDNVIEGLKESHSEEREYREKAINSLQKELENIRFRLDKAYLDKIDGKITESFWLEKSQEWDKRQDEIIEAIELHKKANEEYLDVGILLLKAAHNAYQNFMERNPMEKRELLNFLLSNCTLRAENLEPVYKKPFCWVEESVKTGDYLGR